MNDEFLQDLYRRFKPLVAAAAVLAALSGCAMAPTYERPAAPIAQQWSVDGQAAAASDAGPSAATLEWRDFVTDPSLRGLIETALANNRDLRKTLLNVEAARAMYRVQRADRLPTIGAQASGTRQHNPADLNPSGRAGVQSEWRAGGRDRFRAGPVRARAQPVGSRAGRVSGHRERRAQRPHQPDRGSDRCLPRT